MIKNWTERVRGSFTDILNEIKKVTFPTRTETVGSTTVVVIFVVIVGVFLAIVDMVLARFVRILIG